MQEFNKHVTQKYTEYTEFTNAERYQNPRDPTYRRYRQLETSARATKLRVYTIFRSTKVTLISELKNFTDEFKQYEIIRKYIRQAQSNKYKFPSQAYHL